MCPESCLTKKEEIYERERCTMNRPCPFINKEKCLKNLEMLLEKCSNCVRKIPICPEECPLNE